MDDEVESKPGMGRRPSAEKLLVEVYERLSRTGSPTPARVWEALRTRFAQEWAVYCRARASDEPPEWDDFPLGGPDDVSRLLRTMHITVIETSILPRPMGVTRDKLTSRGHTMPVSRVTMPQERVSSARRERVKTAGPNEGGPGAVVPHIPPSSVLSDRGAGGAAARMTRLPFDDLVGDISDDVAENGEFDPRRRGKARMGRRRQQKPAADPETARQLDLFDNP